MCYETAYICILQIQKRLVRSSNCDYNPQVVRCRDLAKFTCFCTFFQQFLQEISQALFNCKLINSLSRANQKSHVYISSLML